MTDAAIKALAAYFTGPDVMLHNIGLSVPPKATRFDLTGMAQRFFAARDALGIKGWVNKDEAERAIRKTLETMS